MPTNTRTTRVEPSSDEGDVYNLLRLERLRVMSSRVRIAVIALLTLAALAPRTSQSQRASMCGDADKRDWLRFEISPPPSS